MMGQKCTNMQGANCINVLQIRKGTVSWGISFENDFEVSFRQAGYHLVIWKEKLV